MAPASINRTIKSAKRFKEILTVLIKYGFEDILTETGIRSWMSSREELDVELHPQSETSVGHLPRTVRFRHALEELGPTFIKLGQILSTRPDLVEPELAEELKRLQAECPTLEFADIRSRLERELPGRIERTFRSIDPRPLAAASLAQVHRAVLADGQHVVIKVLRPGVEDQVEADIDIILTLVQFAERYFSDQGYSPKDVAGEFARQLRRELNLMNEAKATESLRRSFADDPSVAFPRVYWQASTKGVLTMEEAPGVLLSRADREAFTEEELRRLVENIASAVFRQCFEIGFFHADPHPGNIFALPEGRIFFIDCGMHGRIDRRSAEMLADLIAGVVSTDLDKVVATVLAIAEADPSLAYDRTFRADVWEYITLFENSTLGTLDIGSVLDNLFRLLRKHHIRCPADLVLLIKAVTTVEGVARGLDPSFDVVGYVRPYIKRLIQRRYSFDALTRRLRRGVLSYAELLEDLPETLQSVLQQVRSNRFSIKLDHTGLDRLTRTIDHASQNISLALLAAALIVGAAILILADAVYGRSALLEYVGLAAAGAAVGLVILLIINNKPRRGR